MCKYGFYTCSFIGQVDFCNSCDGGQNYQMTEKKEHPVFKFIVAAHFIPKYCPQIRQYKHKMRGKDGHGKPIEFTESDKQSIREGLKQLCKDLSKII